jgi:hypothetical protein
MRLVKETRKLVSSLRYYFSTGAYMVAAGGIAIIYLRNFSNPFDKLVNLSTVAFTIGSLLLVVWGEVRSKSESLASETLKTSKRFLQSGVYLLLLAFTTPLIKAENSGSVGNLHIPNLLIKFGEVLVSVIFVIVFLLSIVTFGLGISGLLELIAKIEEEKLRKD